MASKLGLQSLLFSSTTGARFGFGLQRLQLGRGGSLLSSCGGSSTRTLYTAEAVGVDTFEKQRQRTGLQFQGMADKFREKMREFSLSDTKNMIFTEDLKNMIHLVENRPDDLTLIHQMMKRFNQQNRNLRFGNFVFGPVIMRMYYHLNQPTHALEAFKDPELEGLFDQLTTYQVLCDLLYNNEMYQDVLDVYTIIRNKQIQGQKFPRNVTILAFAACYKLNTAESYDYALKLLTGMQEFGIDPVRRSISYAAALALNQNAPQVALEVLSNTRTANYVTIRNLKILALAALNRVDDCLPILRYSIDFDSPDSVKRQSVFPDVIDKVVEAVDKLGNKDVSLEFERIHKALVDNNQISTQTLNEMLDTVIEAQVVTPRTGTGELQRNSMERSFRIGKAIDVRPQRNPIFRKQAGITQE